GWTCAECGGYVVYGQGHYCASATPVVPGYFNPPTQIVYSDPTSIELQNLLRELIEKVDLLIEKVDNEKTT
ncbi:hypothetical protein LCGC14_1560460, partial [marine sediment metagenome]